LPIVGYGKSAVFSKIASAKAEDFSQKRNRNYLDEG